MVTYCSWNNVKDWYFGTPSVSKDTKDLQLTSYHEGCQGVAANCPNVSMGLVSKLIYTVILGWDEWTIMLFSSDSFIIIAN